MNQLKHIKKYQTQSEEGPPLDLDKVRQGYTKQAEKQPQRYRDTEEEGEDLEFVDLSNIQNISDLNELAGMQNEGLGGSKDDLESPLDVDNIAVDLDEDELEQMQRMIGENVVYDKNRQVGIDSQDQSLEKLQDYMMNTPPSNFSENEHSNKQILNKHQNQIKNELRQLLAQSSSEQLLLMNDEGDNQMNPTSSEEQELRKKWLHDNGLFSQESSQPLSPNGKHLAVRGENEQQFYAKPQENSIELGEQPLDANNKDLLNEDFDLDPLHPAEIARSHSNSPPMVTSKSSGHGASKSSQNPRAQNFKGSPKNFAQNQDLKVMAQKDEKLQFTHGADVQPLSSPKEAKLSLPKAKDVEKAIDQSNGEGDENDSFHRLYNKEIKVNQDEIPLLLLELTDIAFKFIKKDQFEKAYVLLQKTESVLEVVNLDHSKRDRYFAYITYLNMAMCFQKLGMLEECIIYLKETIQVIEKPNFFKDVSISQRMKQMHMQCQLKLQLCAILSQTQKHTEAMDHAKASVRLAHQILRDLYDLCVFYSNKIKFKDDFASLSLLLMEETEDGNEDLQKAQNASKYYQDGFQSSNRGAKPPKHTKSEINEKMHQKQFIRENSPVRDIPYNILEESISMIERTALKMLPIMKELGNRLAGSSGKKGLQAFHTLTAVDSVDTKHLSEQKHAVQENLKSKMESNDRGMLVDESEEQDIKDVEVEVKDAEKKTDPNRKAEDQVDMRTVLGFLNQNEWILNLNIGNIMQIQPIRMRDFLTFNRNEHQLSRESFLEKLQLLVVSYFCVSTELRFIVQSRSGFMKPEVKKEKELEQEYWHVKALDIACAFLPSECPLFNHILLSYQKHHDPTLAPIDEDKEQEDTLAVLRPLKGIENSKYQPIVREVENVYVDIQEIPLSPLSKCFDQRLLPKKVKTTSINIQTEPIEQPKPPLMKSQSVSIQSDLKFAEKEKSPKRQQAKNQNSQTISDIFDANNAYVDLSSSKYQESLISKIVDDPKIDKHNFLNKLISRVNSSDPEHFAMMSRFGNQNQVSGQNSNFYQATTNDKSNMHTLSDHLPSSGIIDDAIYGSRHGYKHPKSGKSSLLVNRGKNTQSGQLSKKKAGQGNFDDLQHSFEHKSQHVKNHVRSLYRDHNNSSSDAAATAMGGNVKHHIASQSLAPSANVFTDQKLRAKNTGLKQSSAVIYHKKNQSISGANLGLDSSTHTQEMFTKTNVRQSQKQTMEMSSLQQKFNNSVTSNLSKASRHTKKKGADAKIQEQRIQVQAKQILSKERQFTKINLSNEKGKKAVERYQSNIVYGKSKEQQQSGSKYRAQRKTSEFPANPQHHQEPTSKTEQSISKELGDVMSSSYSRSAKSGSSPVSGADPDLLQPQFPSQPEDSLSELNKTNPTNQSVQSIRERVREEPSAHQKSQKERPRSKQAEGKLASGQLGTREQPNRASFTQNEGPAIVQAQPGKSRPSSAITNYTSAQSVLRSKLNAKRLQQNANTRILGKQQKLQQAQNVLQSTKQARQRQVDSGAPLVPKKKSTVLSRKKYGSDQSSNSPPHGAAHMQHGYSIAPGPFSIFDSGNSHSISKISNFQQSKTQIAQADQHVYSQYDPQAQPHPSMKKTKQAKSHVNSQTIQVQLKDERPKRGKQEKGQIMQNQSEHILGKLQNLLVNKKQDQVPKSKEKPQLVQSTQLAVKPQKHSADLYAGGQYMGNSNPRKQANSIGSLGYSQTRQSRYSANSKKSHSRKSRSSGKSASKSKSQKGRSQSNERSNPHIINKSHQDISPVINQSQIVMSNNFLDSDFDARNHTSFELNQLRNELKNHHSQAIAETSLRRKGSKSGQRQARPKTSLLIDNQRDSLQTAKRQRPHANSRSRGGLGQSRGTQQNHSIENLQRQVLENQKILLSNMASHQRASQKLSMRSGVRQHNHNNSISHIVPGNSGNYKNLLLQDDNKLFQNANNIAQQSNLTHQRSVAPLSSSSMAKKRGNTKVKKETGAKQQRLYQYNTNATQQVGKANLANKANMMNLKMTQQHLSQGFKHFASIMEAGRGGISTTASTTGGNINNFLSGKSIKSRKQINSHKRKQSTQAMQQKNANTQFVNFEQMQQQLEGEMTLGGVDLQNRHHEASRFAGLVHGEQMIMDQFQDQNLAFVPHKNLMPKTTGSQAHLLNIQQQNQQEAASAVTNGLSNCVSGNIKSFNSLNQTGRTSGSFNLKLNQHQRQGQMLITNNQQY